MAGTGVSIIRIPFSKQYDDSMRLDLKIGMHIK
jgi:hypothetical protein